MKKKHHTTEQIIRILREAEGSQMKAEEVCRKHSISPQTYYRWKSKYGGMDLKEAQRCGSWSGRTVNSRSCWPTNCPTR